MAHPLASAFAKVSRAEEHLACLQEEMKRWSEKRSNRLAREHNDKRTEFRFYTDWGVPPSTTRWALLLGDGIHNLRSALDHAVYACSGPTPPQRCEFPIFLSRDRYMLPEGNESGGLFKIRGIRNDDVRAIIERAQPWQYPERPKYHLIWMVHELDIQDKHRLITPVALIPQDGRATLRARFERTSRRLVRVKEPDSVPLEDHALIITVRTPEPAEWVEVDASITLGVGVRVGDTDMGLQAVLGKSCKAVRGLIEQIRDALETAVPEPPHDSPPAGDDPTNGGSPSPSLSDSVEESPPEPEP